MKNKLLCLLLAMAMLVSCFAFAGCSDDKDETVEGDATGTAATTATLTLWIPTDEDTTEEAILAVQEAINKITKPKFDTAIELHAIPSDEYEAAIEARITEIEEAKILEEEEAKRKKEEPKQNAAQAGKTTTAADETMPVEDETYVNDIGMTVVKYPEVEPNQMDIFLVRGYDNLVAYQERGALSALDAEMTTTGKQLSKYIYPTFLAQSKLNGATYAIPNNHGIGEFKFLLVNKRLVDELYWDADKLTNMTACIDFIKDVQRFTDVTPFLAPVEAPAVHYWSEDGSWSLIASQLHINATFDTYTPPKMIFYNTEIVDNMYLMKHLEETNGFAADPENCEEFAVGVVSGDASLKKQYEEDYYVHVYEYPRVTEEDLFGSMFAVSTYTKSLSRSMEIITCLNTSTELRTVLQYGVEGTHWKVNDKDDTVIDIISDDYKMNLLETGNVYMTYPGAGIPMSYWEGVKEQNLASLGDPYMGLEPSDYITDETRELHEDLAEMSKEYLDKINDMTAEEFLVEVNLMKKEIAAFPIMAAKLLSYSNQNESLIVFYQNFSE